MDGLTEENKEAVASQVQPLLVESGFPHSLTIENHFQAMSLCLNGVILSRKAELDQFLLGPSPFVDNIGRNPELMEPLFVAGSSKPPTADDLLSLTEFDDVEDCIKEYFTQYISLRSKYPTALEHTCDISEKCTKICFFTANCWSFMEFSPFVPPIVLMFILSHCYMHIVFLVSTEGSRIPGVLMFATGSNKIPPMGFHPSSITVLQNMSVYPNGNTCPLELELPGRIKDFEDFKRNMDSAFNFQEGFGIV